MKDHLTFDEYQDRAVETAIYGSGNKIIYPAIGLGNEAGEVLGKIKKMMRDDNGILTDSRKQEVAAELGDCLWYCAALARDLGISMNDIAEYNLEKLADRKARGVIGGSGDNR